MYLEKDEFELMKNLGLSHTEEIFSTLIKAVEMLTMKRKEVRKSHRSRLWYKVNTKYSVILSVRIKTNIEKYNQLLSL